MNIIQWITGLFFVLVIGNLFTKLFLKIIREKIGYKKPDYIAVPPLVLGVIEGVFFTVAVAYELSGVVVAMIGWIGVKMAAHWGTKSEQDVTNIEAVRFTALLGSMVSLLFAMIGGLICSGKIWF